MLKKRKKRVSLKKEQYFDEVIRLYFQEGLTGTEISKIIPIHNSNVYRWLGEYEKNMSYSETMGKGDNQKETKNKRVYGTKAPEDKTCQSPSRENASDKVDETLEQKVKRLERELSKVRLERDLYNEIINVAEKKFDIQIRKKAGTKQ